MAAPDDLGPAGRSLWAAVLDDYDLSATEHQLLLAACRQADDIAELEQLLDRDGLIVEGASGQPRLTQVVPELRQARLALGKLVDGLRLPIDADEGLSPASRRAKAAADVRWNRERQRRAARDAS